MFSKINEKIILIFVDFVAFCLTIVVAARSEDFRGAWVYLIWVLVRGLERVDNNYSYKGIVKNLSLLYDMAGGENFLEKNLLAPYEIIVGKLTAPSPFPLSP